jgi:hypothetical protein
LATAGGITQWPATAIGAKSGDQLLARGWQW